MQRVATNVEEEMIVKAIEEDSPWEKLPKRLKLFLSSNEEYQRRYVLSCTVFRGFKFQLSSTERKKDGNMGHVF